MHLILHPPTPILTQAQTVTHQIQAPRARIPTLRLQTRDHRVPEKEAVSAESRVADARLVYHLAGTQLEAGDAVRGVNFVCWNYFPLLYRRAGVQISFVFGVACGFVRN